MSGTKSKARPNTKRKRKPQGKWIRREETNSGYTSNLKAAEDGEEHKAGTVLPANNNIIPGNFCHGSIYSGLSERERSTAELPTLKKKKKRREKAKSHPSSCRNFLLSFPPPTLDYLSSLAIFGPLLGSRNGRESACEAVESPCSNSEMKVPDYGTEIVSARAARQDTARGKKETPKRTAAVKNKNNKKKRKKRLHIRHSSFYCFLRPRSH